MNLNTITEVKRPASADEITHWRDGYAWLAGGTWLFSEPQVHDRHADRPRSARAGRRSRSSAEGLEIAATCRIAELDRFAGAGRSGRAAPLFRECCRALLASFKIWNEATVGGNICMSLPAGADDLADRRARRRLHALAARRRRRAQVPVVDFVTGNHANVLRAGRAAAQRSTCRRRRSSQAVRVPARLAHAARPLGGAADRHAAARRAAIPAHHHRRDAAAGPAPLRRRADRATSCGARSTSASRRRATSTTCTGRRPTAGT